MWSGSSPSTLRDDLVQPIQPELAGPTRKSSTIPTARLLNSRSGLNA